MDMESPTKKILFVIDKFVSPYAGSEGQLFQLISHLPSDRYHSELLVLQPSEFLESGGMPCKTAVLGHSKVTNLPTWLAMFKFARKKKAEGFALCHVFFNDSSIICPPVMSMFGIPTLISRRDMGFWYSPRYLWMLRRTRHFVKHVVANSDAVRRVTVEAEKYKKSDVSVIYNGYPGVSSSAMSDNPFSRESTIERLGLPRQGRFVVLVANLREIKRIGDAIEAMPMVLKLFNDAHLVIIGAGEQGPYRALSQEVGVSGHVHFLGKRADVKEILPAMDVGLLCSDSEGYSNAIVEYMQARLPVVASDVGGNSEAVLHMETGLLFPRGDTRALASSLAEVLGALGEGKNEMGDAGFRLANERHNLRGMVQAHMRLYERFISYRVNKSSMEVL